MDNDHKFNINFVKKVESYKCLYDYTRSDYHNTLIQEKAWAEIAKRFKNSVSSCKEKWRNLRDCYNRHLRKEAGAKGETGGRSRYTPYYLAKYMDFIYPFTKLGRSLNLSSSSKSMNSQIKSAENDVKSEDIIITDIKFIGIDMNYNTMKESSQTQTEEEEWVTGQQDEENITIAQTTQNTPGQIINTSKDDSISNHPMGISSSTPCITTLTSTDTTSQFLSQLSPSNKRKLEETSPLQKFQIIQEPFPESGNADLYFLKSLLPDMQSMNPSQKRKLRLGFLNVIDAILSEGGYKETILPIPVAQRSASSPIVGVLGSGGTWVSIPTMEVCKREF